MNGVTKRWFGIAAKVTLVTVATAVVLYGALLGYLSYKSELTRRQAKELGTTLPDAPSEPTPNASDAHDPTISLVRYVSVQPGGKLHQDGAGYWHIMVSAKNIADAPIQSVAAECTFFDIEGAPIGNGPALFSNVLPGQVAWEDATLANTRQPHSVSCRVSAAYNLN